jgi:hypothetical protein
MRGLDNIRDLVYGKINREDLVYIHKKNIFTQFTKHFTEHPYPNLEGTMQDIDEILATQKEYMFKKNWDKYKPFMRESDKDIHSLFKKKFKQLGIRTDEKFMNWLYKIQTELGGLVMQLKVFYNRPRPYQVAYYTKQDLNPFATTSGNSPAYPSGHCLQARFLMKCVAYKYPHLAKKLKRFSDDIATTRVVLGVHYPSDNAFSRKICDELTTYPSIREKFFQRL